MKNKFSLNEFVSARCLPQTSIMRQKAISINADAEMRIKYECCIKHSLEYRYGADYNNLVYPLRLPNGFSKEIPIYGKKKLRDQKNLQDPFKNGLISYFTNSLPIPVKRQTAGIYWKSLLWQFSYVLPFIWSASSICSLHPTKRRLRYLIF